MELNRKTNKKLRSGIKTCLFFFFFGFLKLMFLVLDEVPLTNEESAWNAERDLDTITRRALIRWLETVYGIEIKHHTALQVLVSLFFVCFLSVFIFLML